MRRIALLIGILSLGVSARAFTLFPGPWLQTLGNAQHNSSTTYTGGAGISRPRVAWTANTGALGGYMGKSVVLSFAGDIYVTVNDSLGGNNRAMAFTSAGALRWQTPLIWGGDAMPALSQDGSTLYTTTAAGNGVSYAAALSSATGAFVWPTTPLICQGASIIAKGASPLLSGADVYYASHDFGGQSGGDFCVSAFFQTNGGQDWQGNELGSSTRFGAVSTDTTKLYQMNGNGSLILRDAGARGIVIRTLPSIGARTLAVGPNGVVYVLLANSLAAYSSDLSTTFWSQSINSNKFQQTPVVQGSYIFMVESQGMDDSVVARNTSDGSILWSFPLNTGILSLPISNLSPGQMTADAGTVYVPINNIYLGGSSVGGVLSLDSATGVKKWFMLAPSNMMAANQIVPAPFPTPRLYHYDNSSILAIEASPAANLAVSASTTSIAPGESVAFNARVTDGGGGGVSGVSVIFEVMTGSASPMISYGFTDAAGNFAVSFSSSSLNSTVQESTFTVRAHCLDFPVVDTPVFMEGEAVDHYDVQVPTQVAVGVPFVMKVFAKNRYGSGLPTFPGASGPIGVSLAPYLAGTPVAGSGALGVTSVGISNGTGTVSSQTYNKVEDIQIRASQFFPGEASGLSSTIDLTGPARFLVNVPTATVVAGTPFDMTVEAQDAAGQRVFGYSGTVSLSALLAGATTQAGTGQLGLTNANLTAGLGVVTGQTYGAVEDVRIRAFDSAFNAVGLSTGILQSVSPGDPTVLNVDADGEVAVQGTTSSVRALLLDSLGNPIPSASISFTVAQGGGLLALDPAGLPSAVASTQTLTDALGRAAALFLAPTGLSASESGVVDVQVGVLTSSATVFVPLQTPAGFAVAASTTSLAPGESAVLTGRVTDGTGVGIQNIRVRFFVTAGSAGPMSVQGFTDAGGNFSAAFSSSSLNSSVLESTFTVRGTSLKFTPVDTSIFLEGEDIDHFDLAVPTQVAVGVPFSMQVFARNKYGHGLPSFPGTDGPVVVSLSPYLAGTLVAGSGALGVTTIGLSGGAGVIAAQTYNKTETIEIQAAQNSPGVALGKSSALSVVGPVGFVVTVPTYTVTAGQPFPMTIEAKDALGQRVVGYSGTVSLSAIGAGAMAAAGGTGVLGTGGVNLTAGFASVSAQTYTQMGVILIRAVDASFGAEGDSNILFVDAGPPANISLSANPGSLIQGQTSALSALVTDSFGNPVVSTVTFSVISGSGTVALFPAGLSGATASTQAVTGASTGYAFAYFGLPSGLTSPQANVVQAQAGSLTQGTTIFVSVLVPVSGGVVVQSGDPRTKVTIPPQAFGFDVNIDIVDLPDLPADDLEKVLDAFGKGLGQYVQTFVKKLKAFKPDGSEAGPAQGFVTLEFPYTPDLGGTVFVGAPSASPRPRPVLIPQSVLRIYRLNQATSIWEQVSEGDINGIVVGSQTVVAQVSQVSGIYTLGAPSFQQLAAGAGASFSSLMPSGAVATLNLDPGTFDQATTLEVTFPPASSVPPVRSPASGFQSAGLFLDIATPGKLQPKRPIRISIDYQDENVAGLAESRLRLARYNEATGAWDVLTSSVDPRRNRVTGYTDHLSLFGMVQPVPGASPSSVVLYPNPFRPSAGDREMSFSNLPAGADISIFTVSGRKVRELTADAAGQAPFRPESDGGEPLPSGVYLVVIKSGGSQKVIKLAVER